jgi:hypothetical protein
MTLGRCWFCGAPAHAGDQLRFGMHRDLRQTFVVVGVYQRWKVTSVPVPRCRRCRIGHGIEQAVFYVLAGSAAITGLMLVAWVGSRPWADEWQVPLPVVWTLAWFTLWWGIRRHWFRWHRLAPRPQRYAREFPAVQDLVEDGWKYRGRPI